MPEYRGVMDKVQRGKHIISAAESLKRFQLGDANIAAFLYATSQPGRPVI